MKRIMFGLLILVAALAVAVPSGFGAWFSDEEVSSGNTLAAGTWDYPPTIAITSPLNGDIVSGTVTIVADAADDFEVEEVAFYYGSNLIGAVAVPPYSVTWNSTLVPNGTYTLTAFATDTTGQTASHSISITIDN